MNRGNRTRSCPFCGRMVRVNRMDHHLSSCKKKREMERVPGTVTDSLEDNPGTDNPYTRKNAAEISKKYYCPDCHAQVTPVTKEHQYREHGRWQTGMVYWVCPSCGYTANSNEFTNWTDTILYWKRKGEDAKLEEHGIT